MPPPRSSTAKAAGSAVAPARRELDRHSPADLAILKRLLRDRAPQSRVLGVDRGSDVFLFDSASARLLYGGDLDAIVWAWVREGVLILSDLVAERVPTLSEIAARMPGPFARVEVQFAPDRLDADLEPEPWLFDGNEVLMARGPFLPPDAMVSLSRGGRC